MCILRKNVNIFVQNVKLSVIIPPKKKKEKKVKPKGIEHLHVTHEAAFIEWPKIHQFHHIIHSYNLSKEEGGEGKDVFTTSTFTFEPKIKCKRDSKSILLKYFQVHGSNGGINISKLGEEVFVYSQSRYSLHLFSTLHSLHTLTHSEINLLIKIILVSPNGYLPKLLILR